MRKILALLILVLPLQLLAQNPVHFYSDSTIAPLTSLIEVELKVSDFSGISGFQGTMRFDTSILSFISLKDFSSLSAPFGLANFNASTAWKGYFNYLWSDASLKGTTLTDSSVLFTAVFKVNGGAGTVSKVRFDSIPTRLEVTDTSLKIRSAMYDSACIRIINSGSYSFQNGILKNFKYCPGDSIRFSYQASGIFNPGNQFELQLSDDNGSFSTSTVIGISSRNVDTIKTIIPSTTKASSKYLLRMSSTNPRVTGPNNGTFLIIYAKPVVSHAPVVAVCEYDTPFVLKGGAPAFGTYSGPGLIGAGDQFDPALAGVGSHILTYTFNNLNGCSNFTVVEVRVNAKPPKPSISKIANDLQSSALAGNQWYLNDTLIGGANAQLYSPQRNGLYSVLVNVDGCLSDTSNFVLVNVGLKTLKNNRIRLFPNPGTGDYHIDLDEELESIALYNSSGQKIDTDLLRIDLKKKDLKLQSASGVYIVSIQTKRAFYTARLVHLNIRD